MLSKYKRENAKIVLKEDRKGETGNGGKHAKKFKARRDVEPRTGQI